MVWYGMVWHGMVWYGSVKSWLTLLTNYLHLAKVLLAVSRSVEKVTHPQLFGSQLI